MRFLYGEETLLLTQRAMELKEEFVTKNGDYSYEEFSESDQIEKFIDAFSSMSLFSAKKMIVYKGLPKVREDYEEYFQKLLYEQQTAHDIVFIYRGKPDKRKKFVKFLLKNSESESFEPFSIWKKGEVVDWILSREKIRGFSINRASAELLIELVGTDLWSIESNLLRMETYVLPDKAISEKDVRELSTLGEKGILDIFEALRKKDKILYKYVFETNKPEDIIALIGGISSHLRLILLLKSTNYSFLDDLATRINKKRFYLENLTKDIKGWSFSEAKSFLSELHQLDFDIKAGKVKPLVGLELALSRHV
ncbi:MAG: DNA polymerase III subunit delta [Candidatus Margulisbacteria bacterium]|nr:DNA polymerase III subunit delta [Candidatus Margulisiibacteriota bacterium]